jgi:hypothetical protein
MVGFRLLILSLGVRVCAVTMRVIARGVLYGSGAQGFVCPRHIAIFVTPTIPNDYSSTTTIPNLNCRFPERTVTMQETYADRFREGPCLGEN